MVVAKLGTTVFPGGMYRARATDGRFRIGDLAAGRYHVFAVAADGRGARAQVEVGPGRDTQVTLTGHPGGRLLGRVVTSDGNPVAGLRCTSSPWIGANAHMTPLRLPPEATTDADGRFALAPLPTGEVMVWCGMDAEQSAAATTNAEVPEGGTAEIEVPA